MQIGLMIEGQDGLNWPRWQRLAQVAEDAGFQGLYRSDHFTNPNGPHLDALELFASQTWLASHTSRIEFGPIVSPVSFRNPVVTAWTAMAISDLSGGRFRLGVGAGWQEREHREFGFELGDMKTRFDRFEEAVQVITLLMRSDQPVSLSGRFYQLDGAQMMPRPAPANHPPLVIGGKGRKRTLPLIAKYADEWNAVGVNAAEFSELNEHLNTLLAEQNRAPADVRRTWMNRVIIGKDDAAVAARLDGADPAAMRARGQLVGTPGAVREQLAEFAAVGVEVAMVQWLSGLDDIDGIEFLAREVIHTA